MNLQEKIELRMSKEDVLCVAPIKGGKDQIVSFEMV